MALFLQIVGALCVGLVVLMFLGFIALMLLRFWLLRKLGATLGDLRYVHVPARLQLWAARSIDWRDAGKVQQNVAELRDLGFVDAGMYGSEALDYLRIQGMANERSSVYAAIYEHDKAGVWLDLVSLYENGDGVTHTNAPEGDEVDSRPGQSKVYDHKASTADLYRRHVAERRADGLRPTPASGFMHALEQSYADAMDWRNARGGATEEELRRLAARNGEELTDEQLQQLREMQLNQAIEGIDEAIRENLRTSSTLTPAQWEDESERYIYVYDLLPPQTAAERFYAALDSDEEQEPPPLQAALPARALFARLNDRLPPEERMDIVARLSKPVEADVYRGPATWEE
jgi:hypothetical protein